MSNEIETPKQDDTPLQIKVLIYKEYQDLFNNIVQT